MHRISFLILLVLVAKCEDSVNQTQREKTREDILRGKEWFG